MPANLTINVSAKSLASLLGQEFYDDWFHGQCVQFVHEIHEVLLTVRRLKEWLDSEGHEYNENFMNRLIAIEETIFLESYREAQERTYQELVRSNLRVVNEFIFSQEQAERENQTNKKEVEDGLKGMGLL